MSPIPQFSTILSALCSLVLSLGLTACNGESVAPEINAASPKAICGPGSQPETDLQGRIPPQDYDSGRAFEAYTCNTELVGSYTHPNAIDKIAGYKVLRYVDQQGQECAYFDTVLLFPFSALDLEYGVNVMDMSDPANPVLVTRLTTPAMLSPHESLVLSEESGLLAAVTGNPSFYPGVIDVYDISADCLNPQLISSAPTGRLGHESGLSPDGKTFYSASPGTPTLTAVDISDPFLSREIWSGDYSSHGLSISDDGNTAYLASGNDHGVLILDVSEIQARVDNPEVREIASLSWPNQSIPQTALPFTRDQRPYLLEIDEFASEDSDGEAVIGAARIIDISDPETPFVVSQIRLQVHEPQHQATIAADPGAADPTGGYTGHYCGLPSRTNPDIVACSMILSGLRVFDIRDPLAPKEIAYFNAPAPGGPVPRTGSTSANKAMSQPAFVPERKEIWYTDASSGLYVIRLTNDAW